LTSSDATKLEASDIDSLGSRANRTVLSDPARSATLTPNIWIVCGRFNGGISARLCHGVIDSLEDNGLSSANVSIAWVPGAFELPLAASSAIRHGEADAVVCLGAVIRGGTPHFDFVAGECAAGIQRVGLDTGVPVIFGVLTTDTVDQALERSEPGKANKGYEAGLTALEMLDLLASIPATEAVPAVR
jgi:6,7-dimethyl-8-ribityllumazine synthase